jgi:hypothetical protein
MPTINRMQISKTFTLKPGEALQGQLPEVSIDLTECTLVPLMMNE